MKYAIALFSGCLVFASYAQVSVYDCQSFDPVVLPATLEANEPGTFHKPCVLLDAIHTYQFDLDDQLEIKADQSIHLEENFHAGPFNTTGNMHLRIHPQPNFDVLVMNYPDLNNVERFGKLELAVALPQNINDLVQNFVQNGQSPTNINPFDPQQLEIKAYFSPLYQGNWQNPWLGHGFYYQEFERSADTLTWNALATAGSNFRIRFAPRATGLWRCAITVYSPKTNEYFDLNEFQFNVIDVGLPDFMRVGENGKYFKVGSEPFYPFGMNMPTQGRNTGFSLAGTRPKDYLNYMGELQELSDVGANYFRYMNQPYSTEIEFETLGDYSNRMSNAWEMDQLVDTLASMDLRMHYCLTYTTPFTYTALQQQFDWDWSATGEAGIICDDYPNGYPNDPGYCYHSDPTYGVETIEEFYTDPDQMRFYKNRLRYYVSRWGYSTRIAALEFMNEINFSGVKYTLDPVHCEAIQNLPDNKPYFKDTAFVHNLSNWQREMGRYIKVDLQHNQQLIATDYGGPPNEILGSDYNFSGKEEEGISTNAEDYGYLHPYVDIRCYSDYEIPAEKFEWMSGEIRNYRENFNLNNKPFFFAEVGTGVHGCDDQYTHKQLFVITPFTGAAGAGLPWHYNSNQPTWDDVAERNDALSTIPVMKNFLDGLDLSAGDWVNDLDVRKDFRSEVIYLRNSPTGASKAVGVINNRTVNRYTMRENWCLNHTICDCYPEDLNDVEDIHKLPAQFDWNDSNGNNNGDKLHLKHMSIFQEYLIQYFDGLTGNYVESEVQYTDYLGRLILHYPELGDTPYAQIGENNGAMLLIKVYRTDHVGFRENSDSDSLISESKAQNKNIKLNTLKLDVYPNPTNGEVVIFISDNENHNGTLSILDIAGQTVFCVQMNEQRMIVDTHSWDSGIYYVIWKNDNETAHEKLLVK